MLTEQPTKEMVTHWKNVWNQYKDQLKPNRKSGQELLDYLSGRYTLTEIYDQQAVQAIALNVTQNQHLSRKLPTGAAPVPRAFFVENEGKGAALYQPENQDPTDLWGGSITRIFVGVDTASGFYMVEGSTMLWDELNAFRGVDAEDIQNPYCVSQYIACLERFGLLDANR